MLSYYCCGQVITVVNDNGEPISEAIIEFYPSLDFLYTNYQGQLKIDSDFSFEELTVYHSDYENTHLTKADLKYANDSIYMYHCNLVLDEVVFSANKFYSKKSDIPQQIEIIRPDNIDLQGSSTTADILMNSGKVFVQKSQLGGGSPNIRGFEANKVLIVVDGVRMNNAIFRGGHLQNIVTTNSNAIDNIEVLYGAGSVMYGSDALGGVINVSTQKVFVDEGESKIHGNFYSRFGSAANEKQIGGTLEFTHNKWASMTNFNYAFYGDLRQGAKRSKAMGDLGLRPFYAINDGTQDIMVRNNDENVQRFSGYKQYNFMQKVLYQPKETDQHILNIQYSTSSDVPRYDRLSEIDSEGNQKNAEWYYGPQDWLFTSYNFRKSGPYYLFNQLNFTFAYQLFNESRHTRKFNNPEKRNQMERVDALNLNLNFKRNLKNQILVYGGEMYYNYVSSSAFFNNIYTQEISPANTRYPQGGSFIASAAAFISNQNSFYNEKLFLQEGLRFTYTYLRSVFRNEESFPIKFRSIRQFPHNVSGNVGLVYKPSQKSRLSLNFNTGFRTPNVDDMGKIFDSTPGNLIIPNPKLRPENTFGSDLSLSHTFGNKIKVEGIAFFTAFRNMITTQNSSYRGETEIEYDGVLSQIQQLKNVGKSNIYGFNLYLDASLSNALTSNVSLTYTKGEVLSDPDYPLDHIPPLYGQWDINYKKKHWVFGLYTIFNGKKPISQYSPFGEDNEKYATPEGMPAWWTLNFKANYKLKNAILMGGIENILDRNYRVFSSGISAAGRNFIISVNYTF